MATSCIPEEIKSKTHYRKPIELTSTGCFGREPTRHVPAILSFSIDMARTVDECIWTIHANYFCENIDRTHTGHCLRQYWYVMYRLLTTVSFMTRTCYCLQLSIWRITTTVYGTIDMIRTDCKHRILSDSRCVPGPWGLHASAPVMSSNTAVLSAWWCQQATLGRLLGEQEGGFPFKLRTVYYTGRFKKKSPLSVI